MSPGAMCVCVCVSDRGGRRRGVCLCVHLSIVNRKHRQRRLWSRPAFISRINQQIKVEDLRVRECVTVPHLSCLFYLPSGRIFVRAGPLFFRFSFFLTSSWRCCLIVFSPTTCARLHIAASVVVILFPQCRKVASGYVIAY